MSRQFVLIPCRRSVPLGTLIAARTREPWEHVEFDRQHTVDVGDIPLFVYPRIIPRGSPILDMVASVAHGDEELFISICQRHNIIPQWWRDWSEACSRLRGLHRIKPIGGPKRPPYPGIVFTIIDRVKHCRLEDIIRNSRLSEDIIQEQLRFLIGHKYVAEVDGEYCVVNPPPKTSI